MPATASAAAIIIRFMIRKPPFIFVSVAAPISAMLQSRDSGSSLVGH
jgi:hypothetical protein